MKNLTSRINHYVKNMLLLAACTLSASSCYTIWDNEDCGTIYQVRFKYDYNMAFADAFASQVHSVTLYAFDEEGKLVSMQQQQGETLSNGDFKMSLDVAPGNYQLVAWAGTEGNDKITISELTEGVSTIDELTCRINRAVRHISIYFISGIENTTLPVSALRTIRSGLWSAINLPILISAITMFSFFPVPSSSLISVEPDAL